MLGPSMTVGVNKRLPCPMEIDPDHDIVHCSPCAEVDSGLKTQLSWTEEGVFVSIKEESEKRRLRYIWENAQSVIEKAFDGQKVEFIQNGGVPDSIRIRLDSKSALDCKKLSAAEKDEIADRMVDADYELRNLLEPIISSYKEDKAKDSPESDSDRVSSEVTNCRAKKEQEDATSFKRYSETKDHAGYFTNDKDAPSLKGVLGENWRQHFQKRENLKEMLRQLGIPGYEFCHILSIRLIGDKRCQTVLFVEETEGSASRRIAVDVRTGQATWQQFIDITYDMQEPVDTRIILYDDGYNPFHRDEETDGGSNLCNLVRRNNRCGVDTYIAKIKCSTSDENVPKLEYMSDDIARDVEFDSNEKLPSKEQIQVAEFWVEYYLPETVNHYVDVDEDITRYAPTYYGSLDTTVEWTDEGFILSMYDYDDPEKMEWVWSKRRFDIQRVYPACEIELVEEDGAPCKITIKAKNTSKRDCESLSKSEKYELGGWIIVEEQRLSQLADELAAICSKQKQPNLIMHGRIGRSSFSST